MSTMDQVRRVRSQMRVPVLAAVLASSALPAAADAADKTAPSVYRSATASVSVQIAKVPKLTVSERGSARRRGSRAGRARRQTISWSRIGAIDSYVLATGIPGQATTYRTVTGLSVTPPAVAGQTVTYALRTNVSGSKWSRQVKITYPAKVRATAATPSIVGDTGYVEAAFRSNPGGLFFGGFEASSWTATFKPSGFNRQSNVSVVTGTDASQRNALAVRYPKGSYSTASVGSGGTEFRSLFDSTGLNIGRQDVAYLRYMVKFQNGFMFQKGGKLPGLCGGTCLGNQSAPNGTDNWSGRLMWSSGGKVNFYMYNYGMTTSYGTYHPWNHGGVQRTFTPGKWHCVEMGYKMNTPGQKDGALLAWFDGQPAYVDNAFQYRTTTSLKVDKLHFNTFFGGNTSDWASPQDQSAAFDNVAIAKQRIGCDTAL